MTGIALHFFPASDFELATLKTLQTWKLGPIATDYGPLKWKLAIPVRYL